MLNQFLIYALALQGNKFYISEVPEGESHMIDYFILNNDNITDLLSFFGNGGYWVHDYPIVSVHEIINDYSCDEIVLSYMASFGVHNVRGCSYNDMAYDIDDFNKIVDTVNILYNKSLVSEPTSITEANTQCTATMDSLNDCS
jgi:hypothetical protein